MGSSCGRESVLQASPKSWREFPKALHLTLPTQDVAPSLLHGEMPSVTEVRNQSDGNQAREQKSPFQDRDHFWGQVEDVQFVACGYLCVTSRDSECSTFDPTCWGYLHSSPESLEQQGFP